jgi:hypothetical protein
MKNNIWYDRYLVLKDRIKRKKINYYILIN